LRIDSVIDMSLVYHFLEHGMYKLFTFDIGIDVENKLGAF